MLTVVGLFLLGSALLFANSSDVVPDCNSEYKYRQELFTHIRKANPTLQWDCSLEENASNDEKPINGSFKLVFESYEVPENLTAKMYIESYPWNSYENQLNGTNKFGCYVKDDHVADRRLHDIRIICHFSYM